MRKLWIILLALSLSIIMLIPLALPVAAADPNPNKPVAWVSWGGSNAPVKDEWPSGHEQTSFLVKKLSDGSILGHMTSKSLTAGEFVNWNLESAEFSTDGNLKIADILVSEPIGDGILLYFWWRFTDGGEPGVSADTVEVNVWVAYIGGDPANLANYIPGQFVSPPGAFTHNIPLYIIGLPAWYPWVPEFSPIANVQIHMPED